MKIFTLIKKYLLTLPNHTPHLVKEDSSERIPALDGIRGIAIIMVMTSHFLISRHWESESWWNVITGGWLGVDLFFVLSGFLITGILLETRETSHYFQNFYKRRILRIFPLYYITVLIVFISALFIGKITGPTNFYDSPAWYLTFTSNIAIALKNTWTYHSNFLDLNHFWSIAVEEQFYLIWPLFIWLLRPKWAIALFCAALFFLSYYFRVWSDIIWGPWSLGAYLLMPCRLDALSAGALLALLIQSRQLIKPRIERILVQVLFIYCGYQVIYFLIHGGGAIKETYSVLFFISFIYLAVKQTGHFSLIRSLCENRILRHVGKYSFALYVFHHLLKNVFMILFGNFFFANWPPFWAQTAYFLLASLIIYILARISWIVLEKPFLKLKNKWAPYSAKEN